MIDEQTNSPLGVAEVHKDCRFDALAPQRSPKALNLSQGLRMPWRRHQLLDAAFFQLLVERALPAPGHVLAAVVGQDLLRHSIRRKRRAQDFDHQGRRLTGVQAVAHDEAAVIVHERD